MLYTIKSRLIVKCNVLHTGYYIADGFPQYSSNRKVCRIKSKANLFVLMRPFPVLSERLETERESRGWDEFREEVKEKRGKK